MLTLIIQIEHHTFHPFYQTLPELKKLLFSPLLLNTDYIMASQQFLSESVFFPPPTMRTLSSQTSAMRLQESRLWESSSYSIHFPQSTMSNSSSHSNSTLLQTLPSTRTAGNQSTIHLTMQHRCPQMAHSPKPFAAARGSVKHLTCWYWSKGHCRFTEENCLYAHRNTGKVAKAPKQATLGGE